jgi:hypothetical protein
MLGQSDNLKLEIKCVPRANLPLIRLLPFILLYGFFLLLNEVQRKVRTLDVRVTSAPISLSRCFLDDKLRHPDWATRSTQ